MLGTFMAVLDATIVTVGLPKIIALFGVAVDKGEWILTAYLLVFGVMLPTSGWLADRFGFKKIFITGLLLFTAGSLLCSLSWSINALIFFRLLQGSGAGMLLPVGLAIISREFPPEQRGVALGFWSVSASASVALGPTIGGFLIENYAWHTIFDVNVPIGIVASVLSAVLLREHKAPVVHPFDAAGFASLTLLLTSLLLALASGNSAWNTGGWTSPFILTCFACAAAGALFFFLAELNVAHPLIDLGIFKNRNFSLSNSVLFIFGFGLFGSTFLTPLYLQNSLGYTPLQAGLVFLPVGIIQGLLGPLGGLLTDRFGGKFPAVFGIGLLTLSFYFCSFFSLYSEKTQIMAALYLRGIGMGFIFSPLTAMALSDIGERHMARASGLLNVIRQLGGSFGVAVFGALLTERTQFHAVNYGTQLGIHPLVAQATAAGMIGFVQRATGGTAAQAAERAQALIAQHAQDQAFVSAVDDVFLLAAFIVAIGIVPALFSRVAPRRAARPRVGRPLR